MSIGTPERVTGEPGARLGGVLSGADERVPVPERRDETPHGPQWAEEETPVSAALTSLASFLSACAAAYAAGSLFDGFAPVLVAVMGAALGSGMIWLSLRTRRPAAVQFLTVPVAVIAGALLLLPDARGGSANLPSLVAEALRSGGITQPPVPFDPGWRFLLLVMMAVLGGGAAALATGLNRVKLGVFLPVPILFGALMAQSGDASVLPTVISLVLLVAGLGVAFGVELAREGATSGRFELRRLAKGAASLVVLVALIGGITQIGFLFPEASQRRVIPPERPRPAPPEPDREIFVVSSLRQLPWRIGVLDVYDGRGWLTPPFDTARLLEIGADGAVPDAPNVPGAPVGSVAGPKPGQVVALTVTFTVSDIRGHVVPVVANLDRVTAQGFRIEYDPRTQTLRLPAERASRGLSYSVQAPLPPRGEDLAEAPEPPEQMKEFLSVPTVPSEIAELIAQAPRGADLFTRLQFVREKLYEKVVAKGAGQPTDVPPARVVELLAGKAGTPFEITAAEALLARWVGVPSRIGYGYFGGDTKSGTLLSIRPRHGATWLETYFQGYGWVPIVGTPPRAQSSLSRADKNTNPAVRPSENLTLFSYVPVRLKSIRLLYTIVQYWVGRVIPFALLGLLGLWLYPGFVKSVRAARRRRWAHAGGFSDRILVAYAGFRDTAFDFNVGHPTLTPIEFLSKTEPDTEHSELAWLVTRGLWGDLARDLRKEDAAVAEEMARSLTGRLRAVQPGMNRILAFASRNSLRAPFTDETPNLWWPAVSMRTRVRVRAGRVARRLGRVGRRAAPATGTMLLALALSGCVQDVSLASQDSANLPDRLVPQTLSGLNFRREPVMERPYTTPDPDALVSGARVFSVRRETEVIAALQVVAFKRSVASRQREARAGVLEGLGGGQFDLQRIGSDLVYVQRLPEQQFFLWFPSKGAYYELFIARSDFEDATQTFADILAYQRGEDAGEVVHAPVDARRGSEG